MKKVILITIAMTSILANAFGYIEKCDNCGSYSKRGVVYGMGAGFDIWGNYYWKATSLKVVGLEPCPYCGSEYVGNDTYKKANSASRKTTSSSNAVYSYVIRYDVVNPNNFNQIIRSDEFNGRYSDFNSAWDALLKKEVGNVVVLKATAMMK